MKSRAGADRTDAAWGHAAYNSGGHERTTMTFGNLVKDLRIAQKKTLRQFCLDHGHDPSNWSKLERG